MTADIDTLNFREKVENIIGRIETKLDNSEELLSQLIKKMSSLQEENNRYKENEEIIERMQHLRDEVNKGKISYPDFVTGMNSYMEMLK